METQNASYNPKEIEQHVREMWKQEKVAEKITKMDPKKEKFYLLDGPPYVNGTPHVGHAKTTVFKDLWGRLKYMQGFAVWFQPGFDCGGLPIESAVEKKLGIKSKGDIEKMGVDFFINECQALAKGNEHVWIDFYKKIGAWRGWLAPYLTSENYFIESGWWTVKQWFEKGMLVEGTKPGFWCTHCETVLAGIESSESYKNLEDPSIFIKFRLKGPKEYFLVWTTTPWTLPANVALAVHPEETYVKIQSGSEIFILAEKRLEEIDKLVHEGILQSYGMLEKFPGKDLAGMSYEPLLDTPSQKSISGNEKAHKVYLSVPILKKRISSKMIAKGAEEGEEFGQFVTMDTGTGIVHVAPGHGDAKFGEHYGLPFLSPVDEKGLLTEDAGKYVGIYVKKADPTIINDLENQGKLLSVGKITHSYPLCWRCKTPLIFRMSRQWFLKLDLIKEKIIKANKKTNWLPDFGRERYHNTIEEAPDWAVTRQRYWGIPLPIWNCKCGARKVIGSAKELSELSGVKFSDDLHKNTVDKIKIKCKCGSMMEREKDVMDVWFDSGITPWASLGYPHKNKDLFEKLWTVDLIDESQDQVKAWFDKLILCGFATFDTQPFSTVCMNGWTLDEKGEKMSKSLGNVVSAEDAYTNLGADALRLYICQDTTPWETQKFSLRNAKDASRSLNTLWNSYIYFKTYAKPTHLNKKTASMEKEDKWILSRMNNTIKIVSECLEKFEFHTASRSLADFIVNDFSRTYIKLIRGRSDDDVSFVMSYIFDRTCRLLAPICPFISDYIYSDTNKKSVHVQDWPEAEKELISDKIEDDMKTALLITETVNSLRKEKGIKLKWPLACLYITGEMCKGPVLHLDEVLKSMCNVKDVKYTEKDIGNNENMAKKEFEGGVVYLDTNITEDLKKEALLRELTRAVQEKRKESKLQVQDKIILTIESNFEDYLKDNEDMIKERLGTKKIIYSPVGAAKGTVEIENIKAKFFFELAK